jgi:hypothetical protein
VRFRKAAISPNAGDLKEENGEGFEEDGARVRAREEGVELDVSRLDRGEDKYGQLKYTIVVERKPLGFWSVWLTTSAKIGRSSSHISPLFQTTNNNNSNGAYRYYCRIP